MSENVIQPSKRGREQIDQDYRSHAAVAGNLSYRQDRLQKELNQVIDERDRAFKIMDILNDEAGRLSVEPKEETKQ